MADYVPLARDVEAVRIPDGIPVPLAKGMLLKLTQALGFSYTVQAEQGAKYRIAGKDGDAIGQPVVGTLDARPDVPQEPAALEALAREQLKGVYDPEIPVDIVDLGLVHSCKVTPRAEGGFHAEVRMGLTAPGCGMGDVLVNDVKSKVTQIPGVRDAEVELTFDPPWTREMMSEAAQLQAGFM